MAYFTFGAGSEPLTSYVFDSFFVYRILKLCWCHSQFNTFYILSSFFTSFPWRCIKNCIKKGSNLYATLKTALHSPRVSCLLIFSQNFGYLSSVTNNYSFILPPSSHTQNPNLRKSFFSLTAKIIFDIV